jgi:hypothetical protein
MTPEGRMGGCFDSCWLVALAVLNTALLLLSWLPPILSLRTKLLLTAAYLAVPLLYFIKWEGVISDMAATLGVAAIWPARLDLRRWADDLRLLAELGYVMLGLGVLGWLANDIARRHHNPNLDDPDDPEMAA